MAGEYTVGECQRCQTVSEVVAGLCGRCFADDLLAISTGAVARLEDQGVVMRRFLERAGRDHLRG